MRKPSPVIKADVKLMGDLRMLSVDVRFKSRAELDGFIHALTVLRDSASDGFDHVHLQDSGMPNSDSASTEVTFYRPRKRRDAGVNFAVDRARQFLSAPWIPVSPLRTRS